MLTSAHYSYGGAQIFDYSTETWSKGPNLPSYAFDCACVVIDGAVYVISAAHALLLLVQTQNIILSPANRKQGFHSTLSTANKYSNWEANVLRNPHIEVECLNVFLNVFLKVEVYVYCAWVGLVPGVCAWVRHDKWCWQEYTARLTVIATLFKVCYGRHAPRRKESTGRDLHAGKGSIRVETKGKSLAAVETHIQPRDPTTSHVICLCIVFVCVCVLWGTVWAL